MGTLVIDKKIKLLLVLLSVTLGISFLSWYDVAIFADSDKDGVMDSIDNCPSNPNTKQEDFDFDKIGDECDTDDDNDGIGDDIDVFDTEPTEWSDFDSDFVGDNKDTDDDNDGVSDSLDQFDTDSEDWADFDFDGIGSSKDTDDDNDGILDVDDSSPALSSEKLATKYLQDIDICAEMDNGSSRLVCYSQFFGMLAENEKNNADALELSIALSKIGSIDDCHFVSHEIGHVSYKGTRDVTKSLQGMDGSICRGGYFHGVLASYFHYIEETGEPFPSNYDTICDDLIGSSNYQDCVHGLGHGLVHYFDDDLDSSIDACHNLSYYQNRLCVKGVMMQYTDNTLTRDGISKDVISNLCITSELDELDFQECTMSVGTTLAFHTNHNFEAGSKSCELIDNQDAKNFCLEGLKLEIQDSDRYEANPLNMEIREKYQPQFVDNNSIIDIRSPTIISDFTYIPEIKIVSFKVDREGYVILIVPPYLLPEKAVISVDGRVPENIIVDTTSIKQYVVIRIDVTGAGIVLISPSL